MANKSASIAVTAISWIASAVVAWACFVAVLRAEGIRRGIAVFSDLRPYEASDVEFLGSQWYGSSKGNLEAPLEQGARLVLLIVSRDNCASCSDTLGRLAHRLSAHRGPALHLVLAGDDTSEGAERLIALSTTAGLSTERRAIRNLEEFRSGTGIVGVPTLLLVEQRRLLVTIVGVPSDKSWKGLSEALTAPDRSAPMRVFSDGAGQPILLEQASGVTDERSLPGSARSLPLRVGGNVTTPKRLVFVPMLSRSAASVRPGSAPMIADLLIDPQGAVVEVTVKQPVPPLTDAIVTAVRQWRYEPTFVGGKPVWLLMTVSIPSTALSSPPR